MTGNPKLSAPARELILDGTNTVLVGAASIHEIEYQAQRRHVDLPPQELRAARRRNAVEELAIHYDHAEYAPHRRWASRDPWDRSLAAQAFLERCVLASVDRVFDATPIDRRWQSPRAKVFARSGRR